MHHMMLCKLALSNHLSLQSHNNGSSTDVMAATNGADLNNFSKQRQQHIQLNYVLPHLEIVIKACEAARHC